MDTISSGVGHWSAILMLVFFLLSNIPVLFSFRVLVPSFVAGKGREVLVACRILSRRSEPMRRIYVPLNFITVPLLAVLILLAAGVINGEVVRDGIVGSNGVKPLDIMALFISLAYLSISLDATGLLRFLAFWVVSKGGSSGRRLYTLLYIFFLVFGIIVGNDPVILSGTAFLAYLTRVSGIANPTAWIFSQFAAANMASVVLVSSNPTNLVLSGAFSLSFTTYTAHCIVPFVSAAIAVYPVLVLGLFRTSELIPPSIDLELVESSDIRETLIDKCGAIFGSILLLVTLGVLVGTSTIGVSVWQVTVPPAIIMLLRDVYHDFSRPHCLPRLQAERSSFPSDLPQDTQIQLQDMHSDTSAPARLNSTTQLPVTLQSALEDCRRRLSTSFPTVAAVVQRLPYPLVPFAFLMFILVQGLAAQGWVELFASWWAAWITQTGVVGAVGGMGFVACIFCNFCGTNIGATILLARVLQLWMADANVDPRAREGAIYALALGSNYGAFTLTFSASLAGLLWRRILRQKGIHVRPSQFLKINLPIAFTAMTVSSGVLLAQVYVTHGT